MAKSQTRAQDSGDAALRSLPSIDRLLSSPDYSDLIALYGRDEVKRSVVAYVARLRSERGAYDPAAARTAVTEALAASTSSTLRRVINATGVLIHTNLGRSPVDPEIWREAGEIASAYSNLEFDLDAGERGARDEHLSAICRTVFGCEAAVLTNNNAAGTMLLLAAVAPGREVIVSRGELVEIGGAFRVPDVIQQGGARIREVGTTNRTRARDYRDAAGEATGAMLRVHRSNFELVGFTETPELGDLVAVAREKGLPLLFDEGSGCVVDLQRYGLARQETVREALEAGVDVVTCSTDKLIGATQGGLILGSREVIAKCRRHPLMRAVRAGKESYGVVAATLRAFATGRHEERIAIYRMLAASIDQLRARAERLIEGTECRVVESRCAVGGGTTPNQTIASLAIEVPGEAAALQRRFRAYDPPIVGRVQEDRFTLDVRTLLEPDLAPVAWALRSA